MVNKYFEYAPSYFVPNWHKWWPGWVGGNKDFSDQEILQYIEEDMINE